MKRGLGRKPHPETRQAAALYPVTARPDYAISTDTWRYWYEGSAWLDQGPYGTCVGNAFAHRRADSPVDVAGIDEAYARQLYLDASGDTTYQQGTSGLAACRVLMRRGTISAYHWITTASELRSTVLLLGSVCVGTNWYDSMFQPVKSYDGRGYITVSPASGLAGGHEYVINGINLAPTNGPPFYRMKNSWSRSWPGGGCLGPGTARIRVTDLEELIFGQNGDAVIITEAP